MNGPEHYREAERLIDPAGLAKLTEGVSTYERQIGAIMVAVATAQVHATLALAAATALPAAQRYYGDESKADRAWAQAIEA